MKQGWEIKKLGEVCDIINGFAFKSNLFTDEGEDILRISNIQNGYVDLTDIAHFSKDDYPKTNFEKYAVLPNDIVVALSGATTGKFGINKTGKKLYLNQRVAICRESSSELNHLFLLYYLQTQSKSFLESAEGVAQPNLSTEQMKQYDIAIPPREEQERIVAELDCLSGIIEKKREQLRELDALAQSIFYQMFGDPITNEKRWEVKKLGEVCISDLGKTLDSKKNKGNLYNYLCSVNVQWGYFDLTTLKEMRLEESELERYSVKQGDLLICEGGDTGRCAIWNSEEPMYYQNALHRVRFTPSTILPIFCQYIMLYMKQNGEIDKYSKGQTIKHLVKSALMSIPIVMPPIALQQEFADKIDAIEKQKELIKKSISETETLFNARMDYYFN